MKFWPLNPYYKRPDWETWLSERFSEALTSKLWNKKILNYWNWIMFTPYGSTKNLRQIQLRDSHVKFSGKNKVNLSHEQVNYMAWFEKNNKTVYSNIKQKISCQYRVSRQVSTWSLIILSHIFRYFPAF